MLTIHDEERIADIECEGPSGDPEDREAILVFKFGALVFHMRLDESNVLALLGGLTRPKKSYLCLPAKLQPLVSFVKSSPLLRGKDIVIDGESLNARKPPYTKKRRPSTDASRQEAEKLRARITELEWEIHDDHKT